MARTRKTLKTNLLYKGEQSRYINVLEGTVGDLLSSLSCYDDSDINGAVFNPDCDYEIIIRPKK